MGGVNPDAVLDRIYLNLNVAYHAVSVRIDEMIAPVFVLCVVGILLLEHRFPARTGQKLLHPGMAQDAVWFLVQAVGEATLLGAWAALLNRFYHAHLEFLTLDVLSGLPSWLVIVVSVIFYDFLRWLQHVVQHKVPWFWAFHAVHHSQKHLNLFTDFRYHVFEYLVRQAVYFLPLLMLGVTMPELLWLAFLLIWHARLTHANIRTDFGVLRFILVTPQSHRVHHSLEASHRDRNYGAFLSVWDWIFKTQVPDNKVYPDTGIGDDEFPSEYSAHPWQLLVKPLEQMLYSFRLIGRSLGRLYSRADKIPPSRPKSV